MNIGTVKIKGKTVLAPMSKVTDIAFRTLCKRYGASLIYTEMVNTNAILRKNKATLKKIKFTSEEKPIAVQIFGSSEDKILKAAKIIKENDVDIIDINFGCPDTQIINQGAGSALLKRPAKIEKIISKLSSIGNISAKIRIGQNKKDVENKTYIKTAKIIEENGASAIAVHGRSVEQKYSGVANWEAIKEIKENVDIPVIGNGDVINAETAKSMLMKTNCDFVMIGRGCIGNPFVFKEINEYLEGKKYEVSAKEKLKAWFEYVKLAKKYDVYNYVLAQRHAMGFSKGIKYAVDLRREISKATKLEQIEKAINNFI